jgi:predicted TIM-barrel fold metal-dependent hydrolase
VNRRDFLRGAVVASAAGAGGCSIPVSFEQGLFGACASPQLTGAAGVLAAKAWEGLRADQVWDVHVHLVGNGRGGSGIFVDPAIDKGGSIVGRARKRFFMNATCAGDDEERMDQGVVARLQALVAAMPPGAKLMLLAFDYAHDEDGRRREDLTTFAVPNEYARRIARMQPERFEWIASIHPARPDALEALAEAKAGGARAVKWLPPAMAIDMAGRRAAAFYEAMKAHDMPLLVHVGDEQAVPGAHRSEFGDPMLLRHPLDAGVRVIAAHCATLGKGNFEKFGNLMAERRYEGLLFGDISAVTQLNRLEHLRTILTRREWHPRLLNGSDYPLPGIMPIFSMKALASAGVLDESLVPVLHDLREGNALLFDFTLKRNLRVGGQRFPVSVFETRGFFH